MSCFLRTDQKNWVCVCVEGRHRWHLWGGLLASDQDTTLLFSERRLSKHARLVPAPNGIKTPWSALTFLHHITSCYTFPFSCSLSLLLHSSFLSYLQNKPLAPNPPLGHCDWGTQAFTRQGAGGQWGMV
jgi:hypothetical protein